MGFNRVHIDGVLGGGLERWSTSVAFASLTEGYLTDQEDLVTWAEAIRTLFAQVTPWGTDLKGMLGASTSLTKVRVYAYPAPGADAVALGESTGGTVPGTGTVSFPFQCSLVFTLNTGRPGRSYRGRMYWPMIAGSLSSSGQLGNASQMQAHVDAFADMLGAVAGAAPGALGLVPSVVSVVQQDVTPVTQVRVGNIVDTQRRRRESLPETFFQQSV